jgi:hypothetical protein
MAVGEVVGAVSCTAKFLVTTGLLTEHESASSHCTLRGQSQNLERLRLGTQLALYERDDQQAETPVHQRDPELSDVEHI